MKAIAVSAFFTLGLLSPAWAQNDGSKDIYIMGVEQFSPTELKTLAEQNHNTMIFNTMDLTQLKAGKVQPQRGVVRKVDAKQNTENLRQTLQSFQDAIKDLCISQVELNLAFSASAKAWVVVNGEVSASAKVLIKNTNEKCK